MTKSFAYSRIAKISQANITLSRIRCIPSVKRRRIMAGSGCTCRSHTAHGKPFESCIKKHLGDLQQRTQHLCLILPQT